MSFVVQPPVPSSEGPGDLGDDLGELLRAFYKAEMPHPWPAPPVPPVRIASKQSQSRTLRNPLVRSRLALALAASVVLLIAGLLLLPGHPGPSGFTPSESVSLPPEFRDTADIKGRPGRIKGSLNIQTELYQPQGGPTEIRVRVMESESGIPEPMIEEEGFPSLK